MIPIKVIVLQDPILVRTGSIDPTNTLDNIRSDVVRSLRLGEPDEWLVALAPADVQTALSEYRPSGGDTLYVLRASRARGPAFVLSDED
ncbi:hypothetical protein [Phycicoccus sp. Soil748]|uniref:hypothetical protein n=1 Tax=Phycicoccus sp. Soil748 TaxID=1736397 RepID=UPI0007036271|nr:hypothetical protein [Phycicoccus sp. Soil748]KRE56146.1 hypothetical protein ASG70_03010 [Phycicoccus sp. Soil748]